MLTVICGEDTVTARARVLGEREEYEKKGYLIQDIPLSEVETIFKNNTGVLDLFGKPLIYFVENLSKKYSGRAKTTFKDTIIAISASPSISIIDWENGMSGYELSTLKKIASHFVEHKPKKSIFDLLDSCYPGNLKTFINLLHEISDVQEVVFIYTLLWRHIRKLILQKEGVADPKISPWQKSKIMSQARTWNSDKLLMFYEGLIRIDISVKTSSSAFDIVSSLEILACHYLK